jgi:hypothetical protein
MGDPFRFRDDSCWECIVKELRESKHSDAADALQAALDSPMRDRALRTFEMVHRGHSLLVDNAATTCRIRGKCRS